MMLLTAGVVLPGSAPPHRHSTNADSAKDTALSEAAMAGSSLQALAQPRSAAQINAPKPGRSEPFLLLLMGALLIAVGTSIRLLTESRRRGARPVHGIGDGWKRVSRRADDGY